MNSHLKQSQSYSSERQEKQHEFLIRVQGKNLGNNESVRLNVCTKKKKHKLLEIEVLVDTQKIPCSCSKEKTHLSILFFPERLYKHSETTWTTKTHLPKISHKRLHRNQAVLSRPLHNKKPNQLLLNNLNEQSFGAW